MTAVYWGLFGLVCVYLIYLVGVELERRKRVQRLRERRLRRRHLDSLEPKRWQP